MDQNFTSSLTPNQDQDFNSNPPVDIKQLNGKIRNILLSLVALVFVTVMFYSASTFSYYSDDVKSGSNKISSGSLDMEIIELSEVGGVTVPFENNVRIVPAMTVSKIVKMRNSGTLPIEVRVKIEITIDKPEAELPANWRELISFDLNLDNPETVAVEGTWIFRDGYYYYMLPVESGMVTTPLFEHVTFSSLMGNEFTNSTINVKIICEASQEGVDVWPTATAELN